MQHCDNEPLLIPPRVWDILLRKDMLIQVGDKWIFEDKVWVAKSEYMPTSEKSPPRIPDANTKSIFIPNTKKAKNWRSG